MRLTSQDIVKLTDGVLAGDPDILITGAAGLAEATATDVSFLSNPKYAALLATTRAGLLLLAPGMASASSTYITVANPQLAFARVLQKLAEERASFPPGIHPSAVIAKSVRLGSGASIGAYVVIDDDVAIGDGAVILPHVYIGRGSRIGAQCLLYPHVTIREHCVLGNRVIIHPGAVVGADGFGFVPTKDGYVKIPQIGTVEIGDDVEIGANVTVDRATTGVTRIDAGTKIDNLVQVAHNVHIGKHCVIASQTGIAGSARIGNWVTFGGQSGTVGHNTIGDGAVIAARGAVIGDVAPKQTVSGYPARPHREALRIQAILQKLPALYEEITKTLKKDT